MPRAPKPKQARRTKAAPLSPRKGVSRELFLFAGVFIAAGALLWQTSGGGRQLSLPGTDPGPVHVHGLGVNPADGALLIATHTGLFRVAKDERKAERVADRYQDTMGFTVVGPDRFLGSGHPDLQEASEKDLPSLLGLIESRDSGETWQPISLLGQADFHALRSVGDHVYGYDSSNDRLLVSDNRGRRWRELTKPGPLADLAVNSDDEERIVATSVGGAEEGLFESRDGGGSWKQIGDVVGLMAWPKRLYLVDGAGQVFASSNGGHRLERRGEVGGTPAALVAEGPDELYVALHNGTIKRSTNGGTTWRIRSSP